MKTDWLGTISYEAALELQECLVEKMISGCGDETILLLEHEPVYTIGRTRDQSSLRERERLPHPVFETNRGGQATYHGPGQLVGYPILDLNRRGRDLHVYLRGLEEALILLCRAHAVPATRRDGLTGVWIEDRKLASIGVGVRKWISMHGFALNVTEAAMGSFEHITPCGIAQVTMTCLERECGRSLNVRDIAEEALDLLIANLPPVLS